MAVFSAGKYRLPLGKKAYVMGILNVTPDSFSDGGCFFSTEQAVQHALAMRDDGADIIDIGAQSTRPGSTRIAPEQELERLLPVLKQLRNQLNIPISVDTFYPQVAAAALEHGASIINDVTGFDDSAMVDVAAKSDCGCIVMHHTGTDFDIISDVRAYFFKQLDILHSAGINSERICFDPGIGFGKTHVGIIATGDQFIGNGDRLKQIAAEFGAVACEMEGGSIAQVCYINHLDFVVIRAISDNADDNASIDYASFTASSAHKITALMKKLLPSI